MASYLPQPWRRVPTTSALSSISDHHGAGGSEYLNTSLTSGIPSSQSAASGASAADSPPALSTASAAARRSSSFGISSRARWRTCEANFTSPKRAQRVASPPLSGSIPASCTPAPTHGPEEAAASRRGHEPSVMTCDASRTKRRQNAAMADSVLSSASAAFDPSWILSQRP